MSRDAESCVITIPVYNESEGLSRFLHELNESIGSVSGIRFSLILMDDGSTDGCLENLPAGLFSRFADAEVIRLKKNFGYSSCVRLCLDLFLAKGADYLVLMDADFQDPPAMIREFFMKMNEGDFDSVRVRRMEREGKGFREKLIPGFHHIFSLWTGLESGIGGFGLYRKSLIEETVKSPAAEVFFPAVITRLGRPSCTIEGRKPSRKFGCSRVSWMEALGTAFTALLWFGPAPFRAFLKTRETVSGDMIGERCSVC